MTQRYVVTLSYAFRKTDCKEKWENKIKGYLISTHFFHSIHKENSPLLYLSNFWAIWSQHKYMGIAVSWASFNHNVLTKLVGAKKVFKMQVQKNQEPEQHFCYSV